MKHINDFRPFDDEDYVRPKTRAGGPQGDALILELQRLQGAADASHAGYTSMLSATLGLKRSSSSQRPASADGRTRLLDGPGPSRGRSDLGPSRPPTSFSMSISPDDQWKLPPIQGGDLHKEPTLDCTPNSLPTGVGRG